MDLAVFKARAIREDLRRDLTPAHLCGPDPGWRPTYTGFG